MGTMLVVGLMIIAATIAATTYDVQRWLERRDYDRHFEE